MLSSNSITKQVIVGSAPVNESDIQHLKLHYGVDSVINLQTQKDLQVRNINLENLLTIYQQHQIELYQFPILDVDADDMAKKILPAILKLTTLVKDNKTIYVHCNAGICRATSTVLGYLNLYEGMSLEEGLAFIRSKRPIANPYLSAVKSALDDLDKN